MKRVTILFALAAVLSAKNGNPFDIFQYRNIGPPRGGRITAVEGVVKHPGTFLA